MLFRDTLLDGRRVHLRARGDRVVAVSPAPLDPLPGEEVVDGGLLTPPSAEPHVHLDAALLGERAPNRSGTLREGIRNWARLREGLTAEDVTARARATLALYAAHGTLRVRTHVDTASPVAVRALLDLREALRGEVELQVVAFPQEGILRAPGRRRAWEEAVRMGCDAVGAIPHFERTEEEGRESLRLAVALAAGLGLQVDVHCDETDDPGSRHLEELCALTVDHGLQGRVVAGHCCALASYPAPRAAKVVELVAASGVLVVANPLDNVVLQGRYDAHPRRRGMTRVDELWDAGAPVGVGHDSVMDPWYRLGTANLLDAAHMMAHVGHLTAEDRLERCFFTPFRDNHLPFGGAPRLEEGAEATLCWHAARDAVDALRLRGRPRVWVRGEERR